LLVPSLSFGQVTTINVGYSGNNGYLPPLGMAGYGDLAGRCVSVLPGTDIAAGLTAAGMPVQPSTIKRIAFRAGYWYGSGGMTYDNISILMKNTNFVGYPPLQRWGDPENLGSTEVYFGKPYTFSGISQNYEGFDLDVPFMWDGSSNLLVDVCFQNTSARNYTYWDNYYPSNSLFSSIFSLFTSAPQCAVPTEPTGGTWWHGNGVIPHAQLDLCSGAQSTVTMSAPSTVTIPNQVTVGYTITRPSGTYTAILTARFFTPGGVLAYQQSFNIAVVNGNASGSVLVNTASLSPGFYRLAVTLEVYNECNVLAPKVVERAIMALLPGQVPCEVWPGDVTNNGTVDYGDRKALNDYIHDANLRPLWLSGPARFRVDASTNAMTYYTWEGQPSVPWQTPEGCYMDADGNGSVNGFDYVAIRINWLRTHGSTPKSHDEFSPYTFDMSQNYPNPFNPSTSLRYSVPEASQVILTVTDMLGRTVATLVNGAVESGVHTATFDGSTLNSGSYVATINMTGINSGLTFSKTVKMTLSK
jgi:hypothetical protein